MGKLILLICFYTSVFATNMNLKYGEILAKTQVLGESNIDPLNKLLKTDLSIDNGDITTIKGDISAKLELFKSSNQDRDKSMYQLLDTSTFKIVDYKIQKIKKLDTKNNYEIVGILNLHGVKKEVVFNANIVRTDHSIIIKAKSTS